MNFKINETEQKLRGGYYTPLDLAQYISEWVIASGISGPILEPSCGDGNFIEALSETKQNLHVCAHELLSTEAAKAKKRASENIDLEIVVGDFLDWTINNYFDYKDAFSGVVGNPPFIRYQYMETKTQSCSEEIFRRNNLVFTKHTNCWVPFFIASIHFLKPGGRCGMIVPTEVMHVAHAQELRRFLSENCQKIFIIDPKDIWFENTLQGVCILLLEKKDFSANKCQGVSIMSVSGRNFLKTPAQDFIENAKYINGDVVRGKWTRALLTDEERDIYMRFSSHDKVHTFNEIAKVDVGIVTGANKFFLVPNRTVAEYQLSHWAYPMFGRSEHCPGVIYDEKQHKVNQDKELPTNFLWFNVDDDSAFTDHVKKYIKTGVSQNLPDRYKCKIRTPWYKVPSVYSTPIGMLKRSHHFPKLIYNPINAFTTDTAYRICLRKDIAAETFVASFINSATALSAELEGRFYGGGVLELIPSEIERLSVVADKSIIPDITALNVDIQKLSAMEVLQKQDAVILKALGFSTHEQAVLQQAWKRLSERRKRIELD